MRIYIFALLVIFGACKRKKAAQNSYLTPEYVVEFSTTLVQTNNLYVYKGDVKIQNRSLSETSGISASRQKKGVIWAHNDSGDPARIFAVGENGEDYATCYLEGVDHYDYEDICMGKYKKDSISYIFIADIGDNLRKRETVKIYKFPEPIVDTTIIDGRLSVAKNDIITYSLTFPDGARDAESIMFDPIEEAIYILSKREDKVGLYRVLVQTETLQNLVLVAQLPLTWVVAGDISADGSKIAIKTGEEIWFWERKGAETIGKTLQSEPQKLPYKKEKQGEAFAWKIDGDGYYTMGESSLMKASKLKKYRLKN